MKSLLITMGAFVSLFCTNSTKNKPPAEISTPQSMVDSTSLKQNCDSSKWTDHFLDLKKAIITGDRKAVKSFIDFPIKNKGNEIWYLADSKLVMEISPKEIKPFTEADFDKYFSAIFALDLRKTIEKLDVDEFFQTSNRSSPEIGLVKDSKSKIEASYDKARHKITLTLVTILTGQKNSKFTIYYQFDVLNGQNIKFRGVHVE